MAARVIRLRGAAVASSVVAVLLVSACGSGGGAAGDAAGAAGAGGPSGACAPEDVVLVGQVRNETNPYEASWLDGGDAFAQSVGLQQQKLTYDGDSQQQQEQIRQVLATGDASCTVINALPNGDSDTTPIVLAADAAGAWLVTQWNKPPELNPTEYERWVAHLTYDGEESGYQIAKAMFEQMGGQGGVLALQGILDTAAAQERFAGLQRALGEYPGVTLLDDQTAEFDRATALEVSRTLLTQYGDQVKGIWAANDDMALGALRALEAAGVQGVAVAGIDAVPEALEAVSAGTMTATVSSDGPWQGGVGLAMGFCAATGQLDVAGIPAEDRAFYAEQFLITADNVDEFTDPQVDTSELACDSLFRRATGPISAT
jgi:ribose transport system substrate-binding protein